MPKHLESYPVTLMMMIYDDDYIIITDLTHVDQATRCTSVQQGATSYETLTRAIFYKEL